jgi:2-succinyl-5-enolpyruvyl-6-hydroxy-3-cyclohexene-1-carboxylate synthase
MYAAVTLEAKDVAIGSNRGASGIDGTIATASGFVTGTKRPVTLVLGDLAFLHDLNSLGLLRRVPAPVVVVVFNNDGGGIFSFLPIAKFKTTFERFFGTPHGLRFKHAAKLFDLNYEEPQSRASLKRVYLKALKAKRSTVIEIHSSRTANLALHRRLQEKIARAVDKHFQK